ncbi:unnamed protein product [Cuscuta campestris]|uniref:protein-serine/threonine phosphatase n=1 Tax=Cuscuta campestris TaxID=132261 RepID=A0A484NA92_9ASTE|nr:unnamed protein product [Cuscuta campestris]
MLQLITATTAASNSFVTLIHSLLGKLVAGEIHGTKRGNPEEPGHSSLSLNSPKTPSCRIIETATIDDNETGQKGLDIVLSHRRVVLIVDDTPTVWAENDRENVLTISPYFFFGKQKGSTESVFYDESKEHDGELDRVLAVLSEVHFRFYYYDNFEGDCGSRDVVKVLERVRTISPLLFEPPEIKKISLSHSNSLFLSRSISHLSFFPAGDQRNTTHSSFPPQNLNLGFSIFAAPSSSLPRSCTAWVPHRRLEASKSGIIIKIWIGAGRQTTPSIPSPPHVFSSLLAPP